MTLSTASIQRSSKPLLLESDAQRQWRTKIEQLLLVWNHYHSSDPGLIYNQESFSFLFENSKNKPISLIPEKNTFSNVLNFLHIETQYSSTSRSQTIFFEHLSHMTKHIFEEDEYSGKNFEIQQRFLAAITFWTHNASQPHLHFYDIEHFFKAMSGVFCYLPDNKIQHRATKDFPLFTQHGEQQKPFSCFQFALEQYIDYFDPRHQQERLQAHLQYDPHQVNIYDDVRLLIGNALASEFSDLTTPLDQDDLDRFISGHISGKTLLIGNENTFHLSRYNRHADNSSINQAQHTWTKYMKNLIPSEQKELLFHALYLSSAEHLESLTKHLRQESFLSWWTGLWEDPQKSVQNPRQTRNMIECGELGVMFLLTVVMSDATPKEKKKIFSLLIGGLSAQQKQRFHEVIRRDQHFSDFLSLWRTCAHRQMLPSALALFQSIETVCPDQAEKFQIIKNESYRSSPWIAKLHSSSGNSEVKKDFLSYLEKQPDPLFFKFNLYRDIIAKYAGCLFQTKIDDESWHDRYTQLPAHTSALQKWANIDQYLGDPQFPDISSGKKFLSFILSQYHIDPQRIYDLNERIKKEKEHYIREKYQEKNRMINHDIDRLLKDSYFDQNKDSEIAHIQNEYHLPDMKTPDDLLDILADREKTPRHLLELCGIILRVHHGSRETEEIQHYTTRVNGLRLTTIALSNDISIKNHEISELLLNLFKTKSEQEFLQTAVQNSVKQRVNHQENSETEDHLKREPTDTRARRKM